jgi:hypothetical protein
MITIKETDNTYTCEYKDLSELEQYELTRYNTYETLKQICYKTDLNQINQIFNRFISRLKNTNNKPSELLTNLILDFESDDPDKEQIRKALSNTHWFSKWGCHYLFSLALAHKKRYCHNFKDQSVQLYGSPNFQDTLSVIYDTFSSIEPPKPSCIINHRLNTAHLQSVSTSSYISRPERSTVTMSSYIDRSGGCFAGYCKLKLFNRTEKRLDELTGNELVYLADNVATTIKYIVKMRYKNTEMCRINNDLIISAYHPINIDNRWMFPINVSEPETLDIDYMYNIVLDNGYWFLINNIKCVSLAHELRDFNQDNEILRHEYFGTNKIIRDLEQFRTDTKIIVLENYNMTRCQVSGRINKIELDNGFNIG